MSNGAGFFLSVVVIVIVFCGFGYFFNVNQVSAVTNADMKDQIEALRKSVTDQQASIELLIGKNKDLEAINDTLANANATKDNTIATRDQQLLQVIQERDDYKRLYSNLLAQEYNSQNMQIDNTGDKSSTPNDNPRSDNPIISTILLVAAGIILIAALGLWAINRPQGQRIYAQDIEWQPQLKQSPQAIQVLITANELSWLVDLRSNNADPAVHWKPVKHNGRSYMQVKVSAQEREQIISQRRMGANI